MIRLITCDYSERIKQIQARTSYSNSPEAEKVRRIVYDVRDNGNRALFKYLSEFEYPVSLFNDIKITDTETELAYGRLDPEMIAVIQRAIENIRVYHENTMPKPWTKPVYNHSTYGMKVTPMKRVGVYVPGGTASYPSSVLMNVIPAQVAGVEDIVLVSPSDNQGKISDSVLAVARELGIKEIYRMGGAQAIAALAYGTEDLDPVDKIVGPGNMFVTLAKKEVFGVVGIDKLAGPSDICIVAGKGSNPRYIIADMLAQCEHDKLASAILITDSNDLGYTVKKGIEAEINMMKRADILKEAMENNSLICVVNEGRIQEMIDLVNQIAPEHLEIFHDDYRSIIQGVRNAGAFFVGEYSAEVLGDYMLGPNHVLPTGGTARFSSVLSCMDFVKTSSLIIMDRKDFPMIAKDTIAFAELEKLDAHANALKVRL